MMDFSSIPARPLIHVLPVLIVLTANMRLTPPRWATMIIAYPFRNYEPVTINDIIVFLRVH